MELKDKKINNDDILKELLEIKKIIKKMLKEYK